MSRSAMSKSRSEKRGANAATNIPTSVHKADSARFTVAQWQSLTEREEDTEWVCSIVDKLCSMAWDKIYDDYIKCQLIPFTVLQAREAILDVVKWQFLEHDEGEEMLECDTSWQEDEEPQPATIDAWAQGAVPIKIVSKRQLASSASKPVPEKATQTQHKTSNTTSEFDGTTRTGKSTTSTCKPSAASQASGQSERKPKEIAGEVNRGRCEPPRDGKLLEVGTGSRKKKQTKPGKSKKREACAERVSNDSLEDGCRKAVMPHVCKSDTQLCMECGSKVEASSSRNKPLQFTRLNPERFPTNRVKTSFDIADHAVAAHARGRVLKPLPRADVNPHRTKLVKLPPPPAKMARRLVTAAAPFRQPRDELVTPLPPPLLESMELAAGVSVKEGMRMKAGPQVALCSHPSIAENHLRPLCSRVAPVLEIQELLRRQPTVTHVPCIPPITASKT